MRGHTVDYNTIEHPGIVIIAIVFAILCWAVSGAKNRNQILWTLLGLFFGIVAFIVLLFIKSKTTKDEE